MEDRENSDFAMQAVGDDAVNELMGLLDINKDELYVLMDKVCELHQELRGTAHDKFQASLIVKRFIEENNNNVSAFYTAVSALDLWSNGL